MNFKIADKVEWTSQAYGFSKKKEGIIIRIIKANEPIQPYIQRLYAQGYSVQDGYGESRQHESYLVDVKNRIYWPRVAKLSKVLDYPKDWTRNTM